MKKHRINKIREISGASQSEITPEHHQKNVERVVDMIMSVYERLPANPAPVAESFEELLDQMRNGVKRQSTIIQTDDFQKKFVVQPTKNIMSESEKKLVVQPTKFSNDELELLRKIENGES